ncbi:MAG: threonylcarbamoyl-AMP synthase [Oscillospiraceae bacterium]|jgi:tRNA threonylcarbamoyl adenosine modification protein (Sua5/YciO/YrdC/YwlC family)|nr:threonylcarbamoyl-AMP synthase [Oscillospiraceae bacterium]
MKTKILSDKDLPDAVKILKAGGVMAVPTETVYGLAASMFIPSAVCSLFKVKRRVHSKPLTVHISSFEEIFDLTKDLTDIAKNLAKAFWPGPLTMVLPKSALVSEIVTAGSDFVGVRFPSHRIANAIIKCVGSPLVISSANISGGFSSTTASHVAGDFSGKIDAILDAGESPLGLESTVILLNNNERKILRYGAIEKQEIEKITGKLRSDGKLFYVSEQKFSSCAAEKQEVKKIAEKLYSNEEPLNISEQKFSSRGAVEGQEIKKIAGELRSDEELFNLSRQEFSGCAAKKQEIKKIAERFYQNEKFSNKYGDFYTKTEFILVRSGTELSYADFVNSKAHIPSVAALCYDDDMANVEILSVSYGPKGDSSSQFKKLFSAFRELDLNKKITIVYVRCEPNYSSEAIFNKVLGFCSRSVSF